MTKKSFPFAALLPLLAAAILFSALLASCAAGGKKAAPEPPEIPGYGEPVRVPNAAAECFSIWRYESGDSLILTDDGQTYLIYEGAAPADLPPSVTAIPLDPERVYMAASAVMSFWDALGKLPSVSFSALEADDWDIENARAAMERGEIVYAGRYREPDYELLLSGKCVLSVQSTMSEHVPKVREKLTELGIPVFVDRSSYEPAPLGRCEWVRVYAELTGVPELGDTLFAEQKAHFDALDASADSGKTVAFFYISASGKIVTRRSGDYITKMISLAGGHNVFDFEGEDNALSSVTLNPEEFYLRAKDADVIIYNANIGGEISSIDELIYKNDLLAGFRAVKNGDVWLMGSSAYQDTMKMGQILTDFHTVFFGSADEPVYLRKLK